MEEDRTRKEDREESEIEIIVGHLVDDPIRASAVGLAQPLQMLPGEHFHRRGIEVRDAISRGVGMAQDRRNGFEGSKQRLSLELARAP